jgi:4a-hydroxytetrahydrobiopterin dehydratase
MALPEDKLHGPMKTMATLDDNETRARLSGLKGWSLKGGEIVKTFDFADFREAMTFVDGVAREAERVDHHPDILIMYNKVTLTLSTHSEGGLTEKDFDLARDIDFI